jgi:hypothetical protein
MSPLLPHQTTLQVVRDAVRDAVTEYLRTDCPGAILRHGECFSPLRLEGGSASTGIDGGRRNVNRCYLTSFQPFPSRGKEQSPSHQSDGPTFCGLMQASAIILAPGAGVPGSTSRVKEGQ